MRFAGPVRREIGVATVFNFLGPLANPARARHQVVGVGERDPEFGREQRADTGFAGARRADEHDRRAHEITSDLR